MTGCLSVSLLLIKTLNALHCHQLIRGGWDLMNEGEGSCNRAENCLHNMMPFVRKHCHCSFALYIGSHLEPYLEQLSCDINNPHTDRHHIWAQSKRKLKVLLKTLSIVLLNWTPSFSNRFSPNDNEKMDGLVNARLEL